VRFSSVTAETLSSALIHRGLIDELGLVSILGSERTQVRLHTLETALVSHSVLSEMALADAIEDVSKTPVWLGSPSPAPIIDARIAARHGVLVLDTSPLTVVMVEDNEENFQAAVSALGTSAFQIMLTPASCFSAAHKAVYSGDVIDERPSAEDLFVVMDRAVEADASDIHLGVGVPPKVRVDGSLVTLPFKPLDQAWLEAQTHMLCEPRHLEDLERKGSTDLAYTFGTSRFRVNVAGDRSGRTMALRKLPSKIPSPDDLNLPDSIRAFSHLERGLVLVTGPTGSGKSTTLAAVLSNVVNTQSRHLITLEDPIEFRLPTDRAALVHQRELGHSFFSFADGLRDALRQDPDVILVGELRDVETIRTALTAAETGHLVLATLHTYDAASTVARLVNSFPSDEQDSVRAQLSQLLRGVVSQTLLPRAGGRGRVAAFEIMLNSPAISVNLRKVDGHSQLKQAMQTSLKDGMLTMETALARLVVTGQVLRSEAEFRARDAEELSRMIDFFSRQPEPGSSRPAP